MSAFPFNAQNNSRVVDSADHSVLFQYSPSCRSVFSSALLQGPWQEQNLSDALEHGLLQPPGASPRPPRPHWEKHQVQTYKFPDTHSPTLFTLEKTITLRHKSRALSPRAERLRCPPWPPTARTSAKSPLILKR